MNRSSFWNAKLFGNARRFPVKKPKSIRPQLERLEDRLSPAVRIWDGGGADSLASNSLNWVDDILPTTTDSILIDNSSNSTSVTAEFDTEFLSSIKNLYVEQGAGGSVVVTLTNDVTVTGSLVLNGGRIAGNGGLTLAASADFEWLRGQFSFTAQVPSSLTIQSGATVNIRSQNEHVLSGRRLFNHGVINFNDGGGIVAGELNFGLTNEIAGVINITAPGQTLRGRDEPGSDVQGRSTEFINRGLVNRIGLPGDAIWRPHSFSNRGNLNIQSGNIRVLSSLSDALSSQTTLEIGSALIVAGGSFEFLTGNTTRSMVTAPS